MYCFLKYSDQLQRPLSAINSRLSNPSMTASKRTTSNSIKSLKTELSSASIPNVQELIINPDCPAQILIDFICAEIGLDKDTEFDFCNDAGKLCSIKSLPPWKNATCVMKHLGVYFVILYKRDDKGVLKMEPMLRRNSKLYTEILKKAKNFPISTKRSKITMLFKIYSVVLQNTCKKLSFKLNYHTLKPPWKILFFGTDAFSLESLKTLNKEYTRKGSIIKRLEVVTSVRTKNLNQVQVFSEENQLTLHNWPLKLIKNEFDVGVIVSFGKLIPSGIIDSFPFGMLNVHASLLPRWRGAAPIIYAIANGDKTTGVSIMRIKPNKFDIGDILLKTVVSIDEHMKMPELYAILASTGAKSLLKSLQKMPHILEEAIPQTEDAVTLAPRISSSFAHITWGTMTAIEIYNLERALYGVYPLTTTWNDTNVKLFDINVLNDYRIVSETDRYTPGFVTFDKDKNLLNVQCYNRTFVAVRKICVVGKKVMNANEFNNGYIRKMPLDKRLFK